MMKLSADWPGFYQTLDGLHPRHGEFHLELPADDNGKGL